MTEHLVLAPLVFLFSYWGQANQQNQVHLLCVSSNKVFAIKSSVDFDVM